MGCYTSIFKDLTGGNYSYGWSYGLGWASTGLALVGATISSASLFILSKEYEESSTNFKRTHTFRVEN